jgi:hypothetical protein
MVFCEFNLKIFLWVNVIMIMLVFYVNGLMFIVIKLVNIIYEFVLIIMGICLGCDF